MYIHVVAPNTYGTFNINLYSHITYGPCYRYNIVCRSVGTSFKSTCAKYMDLMIRFLPGFCFF